MATVYVKYIVTDRHRVLGQEKHLNLALSNRESRKHGLEAVYMR